MGKMFGIVAVAAVIAFAIANYKPSPRPAGSSSPAAATTSRPPANPQVGQTVAEIKAMYAPHQNADERFWDVNDGNGHSVPWGVITFNTNFNENTVVHFKDGKAFKIRRVVNGKFAD